MRAVSIITLLLLTVFLSVWGNPLEMETYEQKIEIILKTPEDAQKAKLEIYPLYHGYDAAVSSRWDDNIIDSLKVKQVLDRYGFKGTFFLTASKGWYEPSKSGIVFNGNPENDFAKELLKNSQSIGAHSLNHRWLTYMSRNKEFYEILGCRIDREVNSQSPVMSFGFPFIGERALVNGDEQQRGVADVIKRTGIYHLSEPWFNMSLKTDFLDVVFLSIDGQPLDKIFNEELSKSRTRDDKPLFTISMHAWMDNWGGLEFPKLAEMLQKWGGKTNWWYCNMNEYAAYRYQFLNTVLKQKVESNKILLTLQRPGIIDLNDPVPLSLKISGVGPSEIGPVHSEDSRLENFDAGEFSFHIYHSKGQHLAKLFDAVENNDNLSEEGKIKAGAVIPEIGSLLFVGSNKINLIIRNSGKSEMKDVRIIFRLPPAFNPGTLKDGIPSIKPGKTVSIQRELDPGNSDFIYTAGKAYYAAQIDFTAGNETKRLYSTCFTPEGSADNSYARDGFLVLGPLPADRKDFDAEKFFINIAGTNRMEKSYRLFENEQQAFKANEKEKTEELTPDVIYTTGKDASLTFYQWDQSLFYPYGKILCFALWGNVESPDERKAKLLVSRTNIKLFFVNGERINGDSFILKKGVNVIKVLYNPSEQNQYSGGFGETFIGAFFRITDEKGNRMKDIRYIRPALE